MESGGWGVTIAQTPTANPNEMKTGRRTVSGTVAHLAQELGDSFADEFFADSGPEHTCCRLTLGRARILRTLSLKLRSTVLNGVQVAWNGTGCEGARPANEAP